MSRLVLSVSFEPACPYHQACRCLHAQIKPAGACMPRSSLHAQIKPAGACMPRSSSLQVPAAKMLTSFPAKAETHKHTSGKPSWYR